MTNEISIEDLNDWNEGEFDKTSADRDDNSGNLGIGYLNSDLGLTTTQKITDVEFQYRLDDEISGTGGTVIDVSGNNNDAETIGGVDTSVSGVFGVKGFEFDGDDDAIRLDNSTTETVLDSIEDSFSFSFWIKADKSNLDDNDFILRIGLDGGSGGSGEYALHFRYRDTDDIQMETIESEFTGDRSRWELSASELLDNEWHHVAIVWEVGDPATVYVDGAETGSVDTTENTDPGTLYRNMDNPRFTFMGIPDQDRRHVPGFLSEIICYNTAISESDIERLYFDGHQNDNFEGLYESKELDELEGEVDEITINASVSSGETLTATVVALDSGGSEIDSSDSIDVQDGENTYQVENLQQGDSYRVDFDMEVDQ